MTMSEQREALAYRIRAQISILGSDRDYLEINRMLDQEGKHYARKGERVEHRPVARQNVWAYWGDETDENSNFDSQWEPIALLVSKNKDTIIKLGKRARLQIAIVIYVFSGFPAFNVPNEAIQLISSIGASLDVDLYGSLTGEVF